MRRLVQNMRSVGVVVILVALSGCARSSVNPATRSINPKNGSWKMDST
jgi:hypothetical protein